MPRLSREQLRRAEDAQRAVITVRPTTVAGGFWPILAAAAAVPIVTSASKWVGKKVFGHGIVRAGDKHPIHGGSAKYRSGDMPMPTLKALAHYRSNTTGGLPGAGIQRAGLVSAGGKKKAPKKASKKSAS